MSKSIATETIDLLYPLKGSVLIEIVKRLSDAADGSTQFYYTRQYFDGQPQVIGRASKELYRHLIVRSGAADNYFYPDRTYDMVEIVYAPLPVEHYDDLEDFRGGVIRSVNAFADSFREELLKLDPPPITVWPQTVVVCADCERIVSQARGPRNTIGYSCPLHGGGVSARVVKVVLAPE